jgi:hypothetical protein
VSGEGAGTGVGQGKGPRSFRAILELEDRMRSQELPRSARSRLIRSELGMSPLRFGSLLFHAIEDLAARRAFPALVVDLETERDRRRAHRRV